MWSGNCQCKVGADGALYCGIYFVQVRLFVVYDTPSVAGFKCRDCMYVGKTILESGECDGSDIVKYTFVFWWCLLI